MLRRSRIRRRTNFNDQRGWTQRRFGYDLEEGNPYTEMHYEESMNDRDRHKRNLRMPSSMNYGEERCAEYSQIGRSKMASTPPSLPLTRRRRSSKRSSKYESGDEGRLGLPRRPLSPSILPTSDRTFERIEATPLVDRDIPIVERGNN